LIEEAKAGIVLTAKMFNPSIFNETWLVEHKIVAAEKMEGPRIFTEMMVQFQTNEAQVLIIRDRMQVTFPLNNAEGGYETSLNIVKNTVKLLPETPYQALGLNFDYFVSSPPQKNFNDYNRSLLGTGDYCLAKEFSSDDAKFGRYFSKDHGDARLKLNILPIQLPPDKKDMLQFFFNFHHDLEGIDPKNRAVKLGELLGTWNSLYEYSNKLVELGSKL
jgi:hypothetical protein